MRPGQRRPPIAGTSTKEASSKLAGLVGTVFKSESLRGMLLNAFGWWKAA